MTIYNQITEKEAKKSECEDLKINIIAEDLHRLTLWAANEVRKTIPFSYKKEIDKIKKLDNSVFNCKICPLSKFCNIANEIGWDEKNKICQSCAKKQWKLIKYEEHLEKMHEKIVQEIIKTDTIVDIIRMKSITRNINRKLKNL